MAGGAAEIALDVEIDVHVAVVEVRGQGSIFDKAMVVFECGHQGESWGGVRARCVKCKEEALAKISGLNADSDE